METFAREREAAKGSFWYSRAPRRLRRLLHRTCAEQHLVGPRSILVDKKRRRIGFGPGATPQVDDERSRLQLGWRSPACQIKRGALQAGGFICAMPHRTRLPTSKVAPDHDQSLSIPRTDYRSNLGESSPSEDQDLRRGWKAGAYREPFHKTARYGREAIRTG